MGASVSLRLSNSTQNGIEPPPQAGRLERRVRPEGQKGAPGLGEGRSPRKSARPRKRRSAAIMIAVGACCTSAGGQKGLKTFEAGPGAGTRGCAHKAGNGTNAPVQRRAAQWTVRCNRLLGRPTRLERQGPFTVHSTVRQRDAVRSTTDSRTDHGPRPADPGTAGRPPS